MLIKFVINRKIFDIISHMNSYSLLVLLQTHPPRMKHGRPRQHFRFSSPGTDCISRLVTGGVGARRTRGASFQGARRGSKAASPNHHTHTAPGTAIDPFTRRGDTAAGSPRAAESCWNSFISRAGSATNWRSPTQA